jgi:hypothetical protein
LIYCTTRKLHRAANARMQPEITLSCESSWLTLIRLIVQSHAYPWNCQVFRCRRLIGRTVTTY